MEPKSEKPILEVKSVANSEVSLPPPEMTAYQKTELYFKRAVNLVLGTLEFAIISTIMVVIIKYGYAIIFFKSKSAMKEAQMAIEAINTYWRAALVIIGFILSRIVIMKIYDLISLGKDGAKFKESK